MERLSSRQKNRVGTFNSNGHPFCVECDCYHEPVYDEFWEIAASIDNERKKQRAAKSLEEIPGVREFVRTAKRIKRGNSVSAAYLTKLMEDINLSGNGHGFAGELSDLFTAAYVVNSSLLQKAQKTPRNRNPFIPFEDAVKLKQQAKIMLCKALSYYS